LCDQDKILELSIDQILSSTTHASHAAIRCNTAFQLRKRFEERVSCAGTAVLTTDLLMVATGAAVRAPAGPATHFFPDGSTTGAPSDVPAAVSLLVAVPSHPVDVPRPPALLMGVGSAACSASCEDSSSDGSESEEQLVGV